MTARTVWPWVYWLWLVKWAVQPLDNWTALIGQNCTRWRPLDTPSPANRSTFIEWLCNEKNVDCQYQQLCSIGTPNDSIPPGGMNWNYSRYFDHF